VIGSLKSCPQTETGRTPGMDSRLEAIAICRTSFPLRAQDVFYLERLFVPENTYRLVSALSSFARCSGSHPFLIDNTAGLARAASEVLDLAVWEGTAAGLQQKVLPAFLTLGFVLFSRSLNFGRQFALPPAPRIALLLFSSLRLADSLLFRILFSGFSPVRE